LREIQLGIDLVPPASAGYASQNRRRSSATRVANKHRIFPVEHNALHLAFRHLVVNRHRTIRTKYFQLGPLVQDLIHALAMGAWAIAAVSNRKACPAWPVPEPTALAALPGAPSPEQSFACLSTRKRLSIKSKAYRHHKHLRLSLFS
jgi:hypothetical protein